MSRYLAIDYGEKRVGLAISDPTLTIAQPLDTIQYQSQKKLISELLQIIEKYSVVRVVLGLPLTLKGSDSEKTKTVREFGADLESKLNVPLFFFDERLTSVHAHQIIREFGKKPSMHRAKIDQFAARTLLQTYLDREKSLRRK